jgi:predicted benzoate:H+ symporter BenE
MAVTLETPQAAVGFRRFGNLGLVFRADGPEILMVMSDHETSDTPAEPTGSGPTERPPGSVKGRGRRPLGELSGAVGDLGMLLPHAIGAITIAGLAPLGVLFGYGAFLIATGLFYGLPIAVQPMKAVSAVMLTSGLGAGEVVAAGMVLGLVFLALSMTNAIDWLARLIPQSVISGLQLGLGLSMAMLGLRLMADAPWLAALVVAALLALMRIPRCPAVPLVLLLAIGAGSLTGLAEMPSGLVLDWQWPAFALPAWQDVPRALELAVLPQLPLTVTNALIVTAALARSLFPDAHARASERNLALSTGFGNLLLAPFGAMPMCHGAGGLQAQHRFGARTGAAPVILGAILLIIGLGFAADAAALLAIIPGAAIGTLLLVSGIDLAISRRLFDARPSCWPVIGACAAATLLVNPAAGLALGWLLELIRRPLAGALIRRLRRVDDP